MDFERDIAAADGVSPPRQQPIDIEALLQWAISRSGRLPWMRDGWRELTLNPYTARPRRRPVTNWTIAQACAGLSINGRPVPAQMVPGPDAQRVLAAIQALEPATAAVVIACARQRIRPDWMEGVEPKRVLRPAYGYKRNRKRRGRPILMPKWEPCSPAEIQAARAVYARWHAALTDLAERMRGQLAGWDITGLAAPASPWETGGEKTS